MLLKMANRWIKYSLASQTPPLLRSNGGKGVWSIELTFLFQLRNLAAGVGMKIRPHINCEYRYYSLEDGE